ncbi:MAG TPA: cytochrome c biogenesis CcdA family protein [Ilumatobacteraceae bacterium]
MNGPVLAVGALAAGVLSAASPCVLPVLPGYLATVSAPRSNPHAPGERRNALTGVAGFVAGFTIVFTLLGATASALGALLYQHQQTFLVLGGITLIVLGLHTAGALKIHSLDRDRTLLSRRRGRARTTPLVLGVIFALGWTPCIGPILATVLARAAVEASLVEGVALLLLYSLGLGIPFLAFALWFERSRRVARLVARRTVMLQRLSGSLMVAIGIGYITGIWSALFQGMQRWLVQTGWPPI